MASPAPAARARPPQGRWPASAGPARTGRRPRRGPVSGRRRSTIRRSISPRSIPQPPAARPSTTARSARPPVHLGQVHLPGVSALVHRVQALPGAPADAGRPVPRLGTPGPAARAATARRAAGRPGTPLGRPAAGPDGTAPGRAGDAPALPVRPLGSAQRLNPVRTPRASGHPPWEPGREASQRAAMDGRARLRSEPDGPAPARLPGGRRRACCGPGRQRRRSWPGRRRAECRGG